MSASIIPGVPTDGLKPSDLLWASLLDKPLLFPPSAHSHGSGDLPGNIAFKDQANTFTANQTVTGTITASSFASALKYQLATATVYGPASIERIAVNDYDTNWGVKIQLGSSHKFTFSADYPTGYWYSNEAKPRWGFRQYGTNEIGHGLVFSNAGVDVSLSGDYSANLNVRNSAGALTGMNAGQLTASGNIRSITQKWESYGQASSYDTTFDGNNLVCNYADFVIRNNWAQVFLTAATGVNIANKVLRFGASGGATLDASTNDLLKVRNNGNTADANLSCANITASTTLTVENIKPVGNWINFYDSSGSLALFGLRPGYGPLILNNDRLGFNGAYTGLADTFIGKDSSNTLGIYVTNAGGASSNGIGTTTTKGNLTCAAITASGTITAAGAVIASGGNLPFIVSSTSPADTELQIINSAAGGRIWTLASMGSLGFYGLAPGAFMIFDGTAGITRLSINASGALTVPGNGTHSFGTTNTVAMTAGAIAASGIAPALNITQTGVDSTYDMISVTSYGNNVFKTAVEGFSGNKSRTQFGSSGAANMYIETFQTAAHGVSIGFSNSTPVTLGTGGSSLTLGYYNNIYPGIHTFSGTTTAAGAMIAGTLALNTLYPNPVNGTNIGTNNVQLQFGAANRGFWSNGYSDVYYSANGSNVLGMSVSGLMVNPSMNIGFGTVGNGTFSSLFSEDSTAIKCRADGGFQARNLANSADAPVTCSNLTASGSITTSSIRGIADATYYNVALTSFGTGAGKVSIYDSAPYIVFREATGGGAYLGMATNFIMENMNSSGAIYMKTRGNFSWLSGVGATLLDITQAGNATLSGDITLTDGQRFRSASNSIRLGNYPEIVVTDTFQIQGSQQRIIFGGSGAYARIESTVPFNFTTLNGAAPQGITASDITVGPGTNVKLWADGNGAVVSQTTGGAMALKVLNGWGVYFDNSLKVHLAGSIAGDGAVQITSNGNLTAKGSITASGTISSPSGGNGTGERFGSGTVVGQYSVAIGNGAGSGQEAGVSIGYMAGMSYSCVGIGYYSNPGWRGVAIGAASSTTSTYGFGGVAIGYSATAVEHSVAIGPSANNSVVNTCLIGSNNVPLSLVIYNGDLSLGSGGSGNVTKYVKAAAPTSSGYGNHLVIQASSANTSGQGGSVYLVPGVGAGGPGAGTIYLGTASSWVGASVSGPLTVTNNGPNTGTALNIIAGGSTGLAIYWDNLTPYMQYSLAEGRQSRFVNSSSYTFDASVQAAANSTKGGLIATDGTTTLQMRVGWAGNYADSGQIWHNGVPRQIISSDGVATVGNVMIVGDYLCDSSTSASESHV